MGRIKTISTLKVRVFRKANPSLWHEGLDEGQVLDLKKRLQSNLALILYRVFYWKNGKSYIIQDQLESHTFCISKKYFDSFISPN